MYCQLADTETMSGVTGICPSALETVSQL